MAELERLRRSAAGLAANVAALKEKLGQSGVELAAAKKARRTCRVQSVAGATGLGAAGESMVAVPVMMVEQVNCAVRERELRKAVPWWGERSCARPVLSQAEATAMLDDAAARAASELRRMQVRAIGRYIWGI